MSVTAENPLGSSELTPCQMDSSQCSARSLKPQKENRVRAMSCWVDGPLSGAFLFCSSQWAGQLEAILVNRLL